MLATVSNVIGREPNRRPLARCLYNYYAKRLLFYIVAATGTETVAIDQHDGTFKLHGYKWFTSATDADMALTLARVADTEYGLVLFYCCGIMYDFSQRICVTWYRPVKVMVGDLSTGAKSNEFDSRAGQIEHSVGDDSPPLRYFFGAVLPRR